MTREALDIILRLWSDEPSFQHRGKFWNVDKPETMFGFLKPHIKPLQKPHPPIGVAGLSKNSDTLKMAGEHGFLPLSLNLNPAYVGTHWAAVEEGAKRTGRTPHRRDWRMVREVFVAETDAEAMRLSVGGMMGRMMREYFLPLLGQFGFLEYLKHDPSVAGFRRHPGILRPAQLADRLARHGRREAGTRLPRGRRLRQPAGLRLRLRRQPGSLAQLAASAGAGGRSPGQAPDPGVMAAIEQRLAELGLSLPPPMQTQGVALPFPWVRIHGNRALISGHGPLAPDGSLARPLGKVGADLTEEQGYAAARRTGLAILSGLKQTLGDLDRIEAWLRVFGMVNAAPGFNRFPAVINGFSDLILEVFGPEIGAHARSAVGLAGLPFDIPVEIEAEIAIRSA